MNRNQQCKNLSEVLFFISKFAACYSGAFPIILTSILTSVHAYKVHRKEKNKYRYPRLL